MRSILEKMVEEYNRYRSSEVTARMARVDDSGFTLEFSGPFCQSCGVYDYFEDVIYELERLNGVKVTLDEVLEVEKGVYEVRYLINKPSAAH